MAVDDSVPTRSGAGTRPTFTDAELIRLAPTGVALDRRPDPRPARCATARALRPTALQTPQASSAGPPCKWTAPERRPAPPPLPCSSGSQASPTAEPSDTTLGQQQRRDDKQVCASRSARKANSLRVRSDRTASHRSVAESTHGVCCASSLGRAPRRSRPARGSRRPRSGPPDRPSSPVSQNPRPTHSSPRSASLLDVGAATSRSLASARKQSCIPTSSRRLQRTMPGRAGASGRLFRIGGEQDCADADGRQELVVRCGHVTAIRVRACPPPNGGPDAALDCLRRAGTPRSASAVYAESRVRCVRLSREALQTHAGARARYAPSTAQLQPP